MEKMSAFVITTLHFLSMAAADAAAPVKTCFITPVLENLQGIFRLDAFIEAAVDERINANGMVFRMC